MTDFEKVDIEFFMSLVPDESAIPVGLIGIVIWIDPETGEQKWRVWQDCDVPTSSLVGILEMSKIELLRRCTPELFERGDDD